jgi:hypothetical protein
MALIVFSHANSFSGQHLPSCSALRARGYTVRAVDRFGHDPQYPVTNNWPQAGAATAPTLPAETDKAGEPAPTWSATRWAAS